MRNRRKDYPFQGIWLVAEQSRRIGGEWRYYPESDHTERIICLFPTRRYAGISTMNSRVTGGPWVYDEETDVISIRTCIGSDTIRKCVFREEGELVYLYFYESLPHLRPVAQNVVEYSADIRYRLVRVG